MHRVHRIFDYSTTTLFHYILEVGAGSDPNVASIAEPAGAGDFNESCLPLLTAANSKISVIETIADTVPILIECLARRSGKPRKLQ
jgi:hypothetical protein